MWIEKPVPDVPVDVVEGDEPMSGAAEGPGELIEVEVPPTWAEFFFKMFVSACLMAICLLLMIWVQQEGMLYVPD